MLWLLLFIGLPLLDLFLLVRLAGFVGIVPTVLLVVFTGMVGISLLKREGMSVLWRMQNAVFMDEAGQAVMEGALLAAGGLLLVSPGIVTDLLGFALVLPSTRQRLATRLRERAEQSPNVHVEVRGF